MQKENMTSRDVYLQAAAATGVGSNRRMFTEVWTNPPVHFPINPILDHDPFLYQPQQPSTNYNGAFFDTSRFGWFQPCSGLQDELAGKLTAQEIMDAKALAASKSHSEAERRRRERINNHLAKLRSLLPSNTKTDKASLLAEVIQHVRELKRQTSIISESSPVPTEADELTVDINDADEEGRLVIKATICCEDRSDLLPDLIKTLKALRLRTLKAEITTLGGRVKNVLFITRDDEQDLSEYYEQETAHDQYSLSSIEEALKAVMEKTNGDESSSGSTHVKRQRTNNISVL